MSLRHVTPEGKRQVALRLRPGVRLLRSATDRGRGRRGSVCPRRAGQQGSRPRFTGARGDAGRSYPRSSGQGHPVNRGLPRAPKPAPSPFHTSSVRASSTTPTQLTTLKASLSPFSQTAGVLVLFTGHCHINPQTKSPCPPVHSYRRRTGRRVLVSAVGGVRSRRVL